MISSENGLLRGTVLLNVRGRDVGSFVDEAKPKLASQVATTCRLLHGLERSI
jgi:Cu(I)/Ag(I) efflux system membrane protein CusA/SilA